jgi:hypothetical protein
MCTVRGDSRTLSAVLADEISHFYMYFEVMKTLVHNIAWVHSGDDSRTLSAVLAGEISHFYVYFEMMKRLAHNPVCVLSGEIPGHCQQC